MTYLQETTPLLLPPLSAPSMIEQKLLQQCQLKQLVHHKDDGRMVIVRIMAAHD